MSEKLVFVNRNHVPEDQAAFSVFDRGLLYGDGIFDTVRIYGGKFFRLDTHLKRLFEGLKTLGIQIPYSRDEMEFFTREITMINRINEGFARIVVSRGEGFLGFSPRGSATPHVAICARERHVEIRRKDIWKLMPWKQAISPIPLKSLSYLHNVLAKKGAEAAGYDDAILCDAKGNVIEATSSNLFLLTDGHLTTPHLSTGCLPGITRAEVMKVAKKEGFRVTEKKFDLKACKAAEAIFLTNSLLEIVPAYISRPPKKPVVSRLDQLEAAFAYHRSTAAC